VEKLMDLNQKKKVSKVYKNKEEKTKEMGMRPHTSGVPSLPATPMKLTATSGAPRRTTTEWGESERD
jgi:hypothetical protein